jgi:hypothetical protein
VAVAQLLVVRPLTPMSIIRAEYPKVAKSGAAFLFCFFGGFVISYIWIASRWQWPATRLWTWFGNLLWFYPQLVLPPGLEVDRPGGCQEVVSPPIAMLLSIILWIGIGSVFAWFTRRLRLRFTVPLAVVVIFLVTMTAISVFRLFGIEWELDGP